MIHDGTDGTDGALDAGDVSRVPGEGAGTGPVRECLHTRVRHEHGTRQAYVADRCRCSRCRQANTLAVRDRTTAIAYGTWSGLVDAGATRAHVHKLREAGLSIKQLAALAGVARGTVDGLVYGDPAKQLPPTARIHPRTERRLLAVRFDITDMTALPRTARIPATGSRRRLQALAFQGWTSTMLASRADLPERTLRTVLTAKAVTVATALAVAALYDRLRHTAPPTTHAVDRAAVEEQARRARQAGWRPAHAWDDIDGDADDSGEEQEPAVDAGGQPAETMDEVAIERAMSGEPVTLTVAESREAVSRLTARGRSAQRIAELLHVSHRAVVRWREHQAANAA